MCAIVRGQGLEVIASPGHARGHAAASHCAVVPRNCRVRPVQDVNPGTSVYCFTVFGCRIGDKMVLAGQCIGSMECIDGFSIEPGLMRYRGFS